jgi:hypothetical protein
MEIVMRKGGKQLLQKLIGKQSRYEIVRLENEVIIFELALNGLGITIRPERSCRNKHKKLFAKNPI